MYRTVATGKAVKQATSPSAVFRIVLHNLPHGDSLQELIDGDLFINHLLVGVLSDENVFGFCLNSYTA
ncbi:hypothetical protein MYX64_02100 [Nitrospinae bacterium AH_259_B05_G02_I21]|nr:hypothetical protein [Nitrospinae bacterium AH_259_B05_G02_I21]MDA2932247.1 hypothetical protein [Nitrospinae bacterium AH-259-F20]